MMGCLKTGYQDIIFPIEIAIGESSKFFNNPYGPNPTARPSRPLIAVS